LFVLCNPKQEKVLQHRSDSEILGMFERTKLLGTGGAHASEQLMKRFSSLVGCEFAIGYGISEIGGVSSNGVINPGVECKIEDGQLDEEGWEVGELLVKSRHTMFSGYVGSSNHQREDGFFKTGDLVRLKGREIRIVGRMHLSAVKMRSGVWFSAEETEMRVKDELGRRISEVCCFLDEDESIVAVVVTNEKIESLNKFGITRFVLVEEALAKTL
jgi:long-subunit acyl-CoA synthetase (AMP-forming)